MVRGLPGNHPPLQESHNFVVHHHLPAANLAPLIKDASLVIARSGYSTVMDLAALQKRSILIPTPGQTEQEYLARYLMEKNFALCIPQKKFMLENALDLANHFPYFPYPSMPNVLRSTISAFVEKIRRTKA
jgi:predicted glycosyltransferase